MPRFLSAVWYIVIQLLRNSRFFNRIRARNPRTWRFLASRFDNTAYGIKFSLGAALFFGFTLLFLAISEDVVTGDPIVHMDEKLAALNYQLRSNALTMIMLAITDLGAGQIVLAGMILAAIWIWLQERAVDAFGLVISVCLGEALVWFIKWLVLRPRPGPDHALVSALGGSFPSGHVFVAFAFYGYITWELSRSAKGAVRAAYGSLFVLASAAVGLSRIYLGAHWPSDVIASFFLGAAWLSALFTLIPLWEPALEPRHHAHSNHWLGTALPTVFVLIWLTTYGYNYLLDLHRLGLI